MVLQGIWVWTIRLLALVRQKFCATPKSISLVKPFQDPSLFVRRGEYHWQDSSYSFSDRTYSQTSLRSFHPCPYKFGIFLDIATSWSNVVGTVTNKAVGAAANKVWVNFIAICGRRWSNEASNLCRRMFYEETTFITHRKGFRILNSHY